MNEWWELRSPKLKLMHHFHCKLLWCNKVALWVVLLRNAVLVICKLVCEIAAPPTKGKEFQIAIPGSISPFKIRKKPKPKIGLLLLQVVVQRLHLGFFAAHPYSASWCELAVTPTKEKREESQPNPPTQSLLFGILRVEKGGNPKPKTRNLAQWP